MNRRKFFSVAAGLVLTPALAETSIGPRFKYLPAETSSPDYIQLQRWFDNGNVGAWSIQTSNAGLIGIDPKSMRRLWRSAKVSIEVPLRQTAAEFNADVRRILSESQS